MSRKSMRTLMLSLVAILVLSMAAFAAGEIALNGSTVFTLKYDGKNFTGSQYLKLNSSIKGATVKITLHDDSSGNWKNIPFWGTWPLNNAYQFYPYRVSVDVKGAWIPKGPKVTTTFGDFNTGLPAYVSGQYNKNTLAGIKVSDIPLYNNVTASSFFGWPKYGTAHTILGNNPDKFLNFGGQITSKLIPGMTLELFGVNHDNEGLFGFMYYGEGLNQVIEARVNSARGADQLCLFTPGSITNTNPWGLELLINAENNTVINKGANVITKDKAIPANQYVLSGHGKMATFLDGFKVGDSVKVSVGSGSKGESSYGLEAFGSVVGLNYNVKFLGQNVYKKTEVGKEATNQFGTLVNADYTLDFKPVAAKLSAGFRMIDQELSPFAKRVTDDYYTNPYDDKRGQIGGNTGLKLTLPLSTTFDITGDYYNKESAKLDNYSGSVSLTNSHFFGVTATAKVNGSRAVYPTEAKDSLKTSASLAKGIKLPNKDVIDTKYEFSTSELVKKELKDITFTNKLTLKSTLNLPIINKVTLEGIGTLVTLDSKTTPTLSGKINYTFANNVALEAKATKTDKNPVVWYTQIQYTASW